MKKAAEFDSGIAILKQDEWETLISFIISQNNNIPRIKKIIRKISAEYGVNICLQNNIKKCPLSKIDVPPCHEKCKDCGICYTFPKAEDIKNCPEKLLSANPGFRYKYLCNATEKVLSGEVRLDMISAARSASHTIDSLMKIKGVGLKVASCCALFAFSNLEAFPIDVWMKRAIDTYFDGNLNPESLGRYAGVAQQYIFHYIRNIENSSLS
jgi:N-glycosylase/DNA lyase